MRANATSLPFSSTTAINMLAFISVAFSLTLRTHSSARVSVIDITIILLVLPHPDLRSTPSRLSRLLMELGGYELMWHRRPHYKYLPQQPEFLPRQSP